MTVAKSDRWAQIHREALTEFDDIHAVCRPQRERALMSRRFVWQSGAQWSGAVGEQFDKQIKLEFNEIALAVMRIFSEYRNNRITVLFQAKDGSDKTDLAEACQGLYRADEQRSSANEAYDNAFEDGISGGMSAWRLCAEYADEYDEENDEQVIEIEPIFDAESTVFWDLGAKRYDKSDAKRCYVLTPYTKDQYRDEFDEEPNDWQKIQFGCEYDWITQDTVWVCELFKVEEITEKLHYFRGQLSDDPADDLEVTDEELQEPGKLTELEAMMYRKVRERKKKSRVIKKYIMSGQKVLEEEVVAGTEIPVVPFYAKRFVIGGIEHFVGHGAVAEDAQRLKNMLMSWLAEMAGRFDIEKPILTAEQIDGHAENWASDNVEKFPYLLVNSMTDPATGLPLPAQPIGYTKAPNIPPAMAALAQMAAASLTEMLGNQQQGEQIQPNLSGKAVELIQQRLDMQTFIYLSNFAKSHQRAGQIWLSMKKATAPEANRPMKTITEDGKPGQIILNRPIIDAETGKMVYENDLSQASFDVVAETGPSSSSARAATVRGLQGVMQTGIVDPATQQVLIALTMMNLEGEGLSEVRDYFRGQLLKAGAIKPTDEEAEELTQAAQSQQPDAQQQFLLAEAEKSQAAAGKLKAETVESQSKTMLNKAKVAEIATKPMQEQGPRNPFG